MKRLLQYRIWWKKLSYFGQVSNAKNKTGARHHKKSFGTVLFLEEGLTIGHRTCDLTPQDLENEWHRAATLQCGD